MRAQVLRLACIAEVCACIGVLAGLLSGCGAEHAALAESSGAEWFAYGRDPGGSRYSPLGQITRDNVTRLRIAWTYRTGEAQRHAFTGYGPPSKRPRSSWMGRST